MSPYMQIPCFIDKALSYAGLGRYERMVMSEVMEQVYGVAKRPVAVVNQTVIAKAFGIPRQRVQEAVKSLVKSRILIVQGEFFTFNDVFTEWARPDLTWPENVVASLDVSRSSVTKARYTVQSDTASVTLQRDNSTVDRDKSTLQRDTSTVTQESVTPDRAPLSRSSVTTCHAPALQPDDIPPDPPIGTRAELNSEKREEEDNTHTEFACTGKRVEYENAEDEPFIPKAEPTVRVKSEYDIRIDRACARLKEIATKRTGNEDFGDSVSQGVSRFMAEGYGAAEIEAALIKALNTLVPQGKHQLNWHKYVTTTLQGMQGSNSGGPAPRRTSDAPKGAAYQIFKAPKDEDLSQYVPSPSRMAYLKAQGLR